MCASDSSMAIAPARRPQFTFRDLLAFFFGIAAGFAALPEPGIWNTWAFVDDALLTAAAAWCVVGLVTQVRELVSNDAGTRGLPAEARFGWQFAIAWRLAIVGILASMASLLILENRHVLLLPRTLGHTEVNLDQREGLFYLSFLVVVASVRGRRPVVAPTLRGRIWSLFGLLAGIFLALMILADRTLGTWLTYILCRGVAASRPFEYSNPETGHFDGPAAARFACLSVLASGLAATNFFIAHRLARQWDRGIRRRLLWIALQATGAVVLILYAAWVRTRGLASLSPDMSEGFWLGHAPPTWLFTAGLAIEVAVVVAYRFVVQGASASTAIATTSLRRSPYWHERRFVLLLIPASVGFDFLYSLSFELERKRFDLVTFVSEFLQQLDWLLLGAVAILAAQKAWRRLDSTATHPLALRAGCFVAVSLAVLASVVTAITAVAGLSFAVWLIPWYR